MREKVKEKERGEGEKERERERERGSIVPSVCNKSRARVFYL
jgi:hypothetical protein